MQDVIEIQSEDENQERKKRKLNDSGSAVCVICFDNWTVSGPHQICCLQCGHLFGRSCISQWLRKRTQCPTCNAKARPDHIRLLYADTIVAVDTSERDRLQKLLDEEKNLRHKLETEQRTLQTQIEALQSANQKLQRQQQRKNLFKLKEVISLGHHKEARVLHFNREQNLLVVSTEDRSRNAASSRANCAGLQRISLFNTKHSDWMPIHSKTIRDVKCRSITCSGAKGGSQFQSQSQSQSSNSSLVLTASADKSVAISSLHNKTAVLSYQVADNAQVWSCEWDSTNEHQLYCGTNMGRIFVYDMRQTKTHLSSIRHFDSERQRPIPIHSLRHLGNGLLVGTLQGMYVLGAEPTLFNYQSEQLSEQQQKLFHVDSELSSESFLYPCDVSICTGSCFSVAFDSISRLAMASFRMTDTSPSYHSIYSMPAISDASIQPIGSKIEGFTNRTILSRATLFTSTRLQSLLTDSDQPTDSTTSPSSSEAHAYSNNAFAVSGDEVSRQLLIWNVNDGKLVHRITGEESSAAAAFSQPVLDTTHIATQNGQSELLAVLTKDSLSLYGV